jgi:hypothetical protein
MTDYNVLSQVNDDGEWIQAKKPTTKTTTVHAPRNSKSQILPIIPSMSISLSDIAMKYCILNVIKKCAGDECGRPHLPAAFVQKIQTITFGLPKFLHFDMDHLSNHLRQNMGLRFVKILISFCLHHIKISCGEIRKRSEYCGLTFCYSTNAEGTHIMCKFHVDIMFQSNPFSAKLINGDEKVHRFSEQSYAIKAEEYPEMNKASGITPTIPIFTIPTDSGNSKYKEKKSVSIKRTDEEINDLLCLTSSVIDCNKQLQKRIEELIEKNDQLLQRNAELGYEKKLKGLVPLSIRIQHKGDHSDITYHQY